jgi:hypothetical protein
MSTHYIRRIYCIYIHISLCIIPCKTLCPSVCLCVALDNDVSCRHGVTSSRGYNSKGGYATNGARNAICLSVGLLVCLWHWTTTSSRGYRFQRGVCNQRCTGPACISYIPIHLTGCTRTVQAVVRFDGLTAIPHPSYCLAVPCRCCVCILQTKWGTFGGMSIELTIMA